MLATELSQGSPQLGILRGPGGTPVGGQGEWDRGQEENAHDAWEKGNRR